MRRVLCAVTALFLTQCVTLSRGPMQRVRVESNPTGASVTLEDCGAASTDHATTPATVFVNRRATRCAITMSHPDYPSRTVPLVRGEMSASARADQELSGVAEILNEADSLGEFIFLGTVGAAIWGIGRGIDSLTAAPYEQDRNAIMVDLTQPPGARTRGRYDLVAVNGQELPAVTWRPRKPGCEIRTLSGRLALAEDESWTAEVEEEEVCGDGTRELVGRTTDGSLPVLRGNELEVTVGGNDGQSAVYRFRLAGSEEL